MRRITTAVLTVLVISSNVVHGQECNAGGFYCPDSSQVQLCPDEGKPPSGSLYPCPPGTACNEACDLECSVIGDPCTITTTPVPTTTAIPTTTNTPKPPFECTASGKFADETNCANYYICSPSAAGGFIKYLYTCPGESLFNPDTNKCALGVVNCAGSTTSSSSTSSSTTAASTGTTTPAPFTCSTSGKFPDPLSTNRYYICSPLSTGGFTQYLYTCPGSSIYDKNTSKCVLS